jgi:undecaprenyl-diphosphatase
MFEFLKETDTKLFLLINNHHCTVCDFIFYWASSRITWIPFYIFIAFLICKSFKNESWKIVIALAVLILLSDQLSVFIKDHVMRYRPCHNLILQSQIHLVNGECGGQYGFVSSHASNSAALAVFLILLFDKRIKWLFSALLIWCCIISYSRIYLGIHYPLDVAGGWITGFLTAWIIFYFYKKYFLKEA